MKREYYFVTCDIVAHSAEPDLETQKKRVVAINTIADQIVSGHPSHQVLWAGTGDGGHIAIPADAPAEGAIGAIIALRKWAESEGVRLRVSATVGSAESVRGANGTEVLVGHGINLAGHVIPFASPSRVVASAAFRDIWKGESGGGIRFHDPRVVRLKHGNMQELSLLSIAGEFESGWDETAVASDRALLKQAMERGDGFALIYRARRLLEMNRRDADAMSALRALAMKRASFADAQKLPDLFIDEQVGAEIIGAGNLVERSAGQTVCEAGDEGETMFWILRGTLSGYYATTSGVSAPRQPDFTMNAGELAGELAFGLRRRRTATLCCTEDTTILAFHYGQLLRISAETELADYIRVLLDRRITARIFDYVWSNAPYFSGLTKARDLAQHDVLRYTKRTHLRLEDGPLKHDHPAFEPQSICLLIGGAVQRAGEEARLEGTSFPVMFAQLPGQEAFAADYEVLEDADLLTISTKGLLKLAPADFKSIAEKVRESLPAKKPATRPAAAVSQEKRRLVILIHGIRTRAEWHGRLRNLFESDGKTIVEPIGYGYFDVLRFLCPLWTRRKPINVVLGKIRHALNIHRGEYDEWTVVAHSFGTYLVGAILHENPDIRPDRLLLCGCILPSEYGWDRLPNRPRAVLNEAGSRDIWPILAKSMTWGYGSTGTFGFQTPGVRDRFHDAAHSDYFAPGFAEKYWLPWLRADDHKATEYESGVRTPTPFHKNLVELIPIKWVVPVAALIILGAAIKLRWP